MTSEKNYAGFWKRLKAFFIDLLVIGIPIILLNWPWGYDYQKQPVEYEIAYSAYHLMITFLYFAYTVIMYVEYNGQTLGKRVAGIRVVMEDGSKLTYGKALIREIGSYVSFVVLFLGYFWVIWDKKKQTWHDKIAQTLVIKA